MGVQKKWNIHEDSILRSMYALRKSSSEIAQVLGRSCDSIESYARRRGIVKPVVRTTPIRAVTVKRQASKPEYIDCMPNPFERLGKRYGFDKNFYRHV